MKQMKKPSSPARVQWNGQTAGQKWSFLTAAVYPVSPPPEPAKPPPMFQDGHTSFAILCESIIGSLSTNIVNFRQIVKWVREFVFSLSTTFLLVREKIEEKVGVPVWRSRTGKNGTLYEP